MVEEGPEVHPPAPVEREPREGFAGEWLVSSWGLLSLSGEVDAGLPGDPASAVGDELRARGVEVPADWADAYRETHVDAPAGAEVPLPAHVSRALDSRGVDAPGNAVRRAVVAVFDPTDTARSGAVGAIIDARGDDPVGLLVNCAVPELVGRVLVRSDLARDDFDAILRASPADGAPRPAGVRHAAAALGIDPGDLTHVGADPSVDGGITAVDGLLARVGADGSGLRVD